jgi:hypothetical protein
MPWLRHSYSLPSKVVLSSRFFLGRGLGAGGNVSNSSAVLFISH